MRRYTSTTCHATTLLSFPKFQKHNLKVKNYKLISFM